ncbi:chaplin [Streptomyces bambusae]|uniref:chaplin n=1 Tax=Streptomyces bambusae TaxID=1550616 RepID=UPI0027E1A3ED|nr:chaplin [Streptomyces bambusae]
MVAGGGLAAAGAGALAFADAGASGQAQNSPGLLSGNLVQLPVHVPVNVCGNTVNVVGVLNPAAGNRCANESGQPAPNPSGSPHGSKPGGGNGGGSAAHGGTKDSPGVLSGNGIQLPVDVPVNVSGNAVSVVGVGNGASGNTSVNGTVPPRPATSTPPATVRPTPPAVQSPAQPPAQPGPGTSSLAHTGADAVGYLLPGGGALLLGGALLYRRFRHN